MSYKRGNYILVNGMFATVKRIRSAIGMQFLMDGAVWDEYHGCWRMTTWRIDGSHHSGEPGLAIDREVEEADDASGLSGSVP